MHSVIQSKLPFRDMYTHFFLLGLLAVVGSLTVHSRWSSILLTWDPPFSLDITGVDPDLCYCVEVYNIRRGRALLTTNCSVYATQFYFNATNPSQCDVLEVRVFAVNQVGNGTLTSVSGTFHASKFCLHLKCRKNIQNGSEM